MSHRVIDLFTRRSLDDMPAPRRPYDELVSARRDARLWRDEYERMRKLCENWEGYAMGCERDYQDEKQRRMAAEKKLADALKAQDDKPLWRKLWGI